jgi:tRNA-(guanine-N1)-methyltransferase
VGRKKALRIDIVTIFPEYFGSPLGVSLIGKAAARGDIEFEVHDLRRWATDVHHTVDDLPFGGGPGMVMKPDVWGDALDEIVPAGRRVRPAGRPGAERSAVHSGHRGQIRGRAAAGVRLRALRGHRRPGRRGDARPDAGGRDQHRRLRAGRRGGRRPGHHRGGGTAAAGRPGQRVLGGDDSFGGDGDPGGAMRGLLEGPVYTRPRAWRQREVPEVLLSGHHAAIARWRRDMALRRTAAHRPDLLGELRDLDRRDREVLAEAGFPVSAEDMAH